MAKYGEITISLSLQEAQQVSLAIGDEIVKLEKCLNKKVYPIGTTREQVQRKITHLKSVQKPLNKELSTRYAEGY